MKFIITISILLCSLTLTAQKAYYVSSTTGNDAASGLSSGAAWRTASKVNTAMPGMSKGDSILLKTDDQFDSIVISRSDIYIGSYGSGKRPTISTEKLLVSWTQYAGNIYYATVPTTTNDMRMVTINGLPAEMGRYPNSDSANGGYLTYESSSGLVSITDRQLTNTPNWTGAEAVIRKNRWTADRGEITAHIDSTLIYDVSLLNKNGNYGTTPPSPGNKNYGYFIQNDLRTLNKNGEWYFDKSNKRLYVYFDLSPSLYIVRVASGDQLINCKKQDSITIENIAFQYSNRSAIYSTLADSIKVKNCTFTNIGQSGVQVFQDNRVQIDSCTASWCLVSGYQVYNGRLNSKVKITNSTATNIGKYVGLGWTADFCAGNGINAVGGSDIYVARNVVQSTGRDAYTVTGSKFLVEKNIGFNCDSVLDDHGVFYSFQDGNDTATLVPTGMTPIDTARVIQNNYFYNAIGNPNGANSNQSLSQGIYLDGRSKNVKVLNNMVANAKLRGIHTNNGGNILIDGNFILNTGYAISMRKWPWGKLENVTVKKNIAFNTPGQYSFRYANDTAHSYSIKNAISTFGTSDSNYYNNADLNGWITEYSNSTAAKNLGAWVGTFGLESKSTVLPAGTPIYYFNASDTVATYSFTGSYRTHKGVLATGSVLVQPWTYFFALPDVGVVPEFRVPWILSK